MTKSLCDSCYAPGQCCKNIKLFDGPYSRPTFWVDGVADQLLDARNMDDIRDNVVLPFEVIEWDNRFTDKETGKDYGTPVFNCTKLTPEGRCGIYANRPWLCRVFEPASGDLCVHYNGAESGE